MVNDQLVSLFNQLLDVIHLLLDLKLSIVRFLQTILVCLRCLYSCLSLGLWNYLACCVCWHIARHTCSVDWYNLFDLFSCRQNEFFLPLSTSFQGVRSTILIERRVWGFELGRGEIVIVLALLRWPLPIWSG